MRSISQLEQTMSSNFSLAMNRALETGDACLASHKANRPRRRRGGIALAALTAALFSVAASAGDGPIRIGDGPGAGPGGPGPRCNPMPPKASTGTTVDISAFPPPNLLTDPEPSVPVPTLGPIE